MSAVAEKSKINKDDVIIVTVQDYDGAGELIGNNQRLQIADEFIQKQFPENKVITVPSWINIGVLGSKNQREKLVEVLDAQLECYKKRIEKMIGKSPKAHA